MNRLELLNFALFDTGGEIDGISFGPLSPPALVILKHRRNVLLVETSERNQDEHEAVGEIFFVLSRSPAQRQAMFRDNAETWNFKVLEFLAGLEDSTLIKFRDEILGPYLKALALSLVEREGPGKPGAGPNPQNLHSSPPTSAGSALTTLPQVLASRVRFGDFPHAQSSNFSTPKHHVGEGVADG